MQGKIPMSNFSCTVKNPKIDKKFNASLIKAMINKNNDGKKNPLFVATNIDMPKRQYKSTRYDLYPKEKKSNENESINEVLTIQKITVHINKTQTYINVENFGREYMNLLSKKRKKL